MGLCKKSRDIVTSRIRRSVVFGWQARRRYFQFEVKVLIKGLIRRLLSSIWELFEEKLADGGVFFFTNMLQNNAEIAVVSKVRV